MPDDGIAYDIAGLTPDITGQWLASPDYTALRSRSVDLGGFPRVALEGVRFGPPLSGVGKIVCIGLNYAGFESVGLEMPEEPTIFFKAANTVIGPNDEVLIPVGGEKTDWEIELAVIIGRTCRYLSTVDAAQDAIAGYAISNDLSERSFQFERGGQWVKGKSCETFNPLGPWLVTPDEVGDIRNLALSLSVNGHRYQHGCTAQMVFSVSHLIWYLSQFMVLDPGDVINTGSPTGVGFMQDPPVFLADGDVMELSIPGLGSQRQLCVQAVREPG